MRRAAPPPPAASAPSEYHFLPMASGSDSGHDSDERELETDWLFPTDARSDSATSAGDSTTAGTRTEAGDRIAAFEKAAFGVDNSPTFRTDTGDRNRAPSRIVAAPTEAFGEIPPAGRSRKRVLIFAAVVVLLGVAAVGVLATVGRNGGARSSPRVAPTAKSEASTSTAPRAEVTTTIAPAPAPSAPIPFTVRCGGRDCAVAVRERPSTGARAVRSLRSGEVVQITCSTHGDRIDDRDTGQQSDVWYQLAGTDGYSSALYLDGPTVRDCG
jgi:hypothetical protein